MQLHHIALRCTDLVRTVTFYRAVLGLVVVREQPGYSVWLAAGSAVLMVEQKPPDEPDVPSGSMELVAFVDGVLHGQGLSGAAVRDNLQAADVPIEAETDYTFYFRDPDGRRVAVSRYPLTEAT